MTLLSSAIGIAERAPLPDLATRAGIGFLVGRTSRALTDPGTVDDGGFAREMARFAIAEHTALANAQHYELPPAFFARCLGPRRKYSCCLYDQGARSLAEAEEDALTQTATHADLFDGQKILELGCGWGSLTLFMAERFPRARIVAVSNAAAQRRHIEGELARKGLRNVTVVTADVNEFVPQVQGFDRVVSVEMFEHMSNWRPLLERIRGWLLPEGRLFLHVFSHRERCYRFDHEDPADWIAHHFFTGGIMPSHGLIRQFPDLFAVERDWRWNGGNYQRTALEWLARLDAARAEVDTLLTQTYGAEATLWRRRWRLFFLATAGLFGHGGGEVWGVSHYLLRPANS